MFRILLFFVKLAVTVSLFILMVSLIRPAYHKAKESFPKNFSLADLKVDPDKVQTRARTTTLNQLIPSFAYLAQWKRGSGNIDKQKMKDYERYYKKVAEYIPGRADAYSMLGFCYYHLGERDKAIVSYQKAAVLNPHFFWPYYNMGMIFFKDGEYQESAEMFEKALRTDLKNALIFMRSSKIYQDIIREADYSYEALLARMQKGRRDSKLLMGLSLHYLNKPKVLPLGILREGKRGLQVF